MVFWVLWFSQELSEIKGVFGFYGTPAKKNEKDDSWAALNRTYSLRLRSFVVVAVLLPRRLVPVGLRYRLDSWFICRASPLSFWVKGDNEANHRGPLIV